MANGNGDVKIGTCVDGYTLAGKGLRYLLWKNPTGRSFSIEDKKGGVVPGYEKFSGDERSALKELAKYEAKSRDIIHSWDEIPSNGAVAFYGHRGYGKTANVWWLTEHLTRKGGKFKDREVVAVLPEIRLAKKLFPKWVNVITSPDDIILHSGAIVIADEMAGRANAREFRSDENMLWVKQVPLARQLDILLLMACQHTRQLDVQLVMDVDWIVWKKPSMLHIRMARPELYDEVATAYNIFRDLGAEFAEQRRKYKTEDEIKTELKNRAYVTDIHDGKVGLLENELPSFWSNEISKYFARVAVAEADGSAFGGTK
jgi:hypothetical protein